MTIPPAIGFPRRVSAPDPVPVLIRDLVHERTGVFFENERLGTMLEKLEERALSCRCLSFLDYYYLLKYDEKGQEEWRRALDALSVQETYFWREMDQVRYLVERIVPAWFSRKTGPLKIWSAACATGEEPFSIAIALQEAGWGQHPIEILASDASESALARARQGIYRERSFRSLPNELRDRYFDPTADGRELQRKIVSRVKFSWANLMNVDGFREAATSQVIFCRNVFIYFSPTAIKQVVASFARQMPPEGVLFVGASESLLKSTTQFDLHEMGEAFGYVRNST